MGRIGKTPQLVLETVLDGVEREFDPFHVQKVDYRLEANTRQSVNLIVNKPWDEDSEYPKWERIDYILRLTDFIETLGTAVHLNQYIRPPE